jgi:hypothetical protein
MRPVLAAWTLGLVVMAGAAGATYATCPGCIDRGRINSTCTWSGDTPFQLDSRNAAHREHLIADAHLAEELAIRYADVEVGRRFGIEHHGGLLDGGHPRRECLSRMLHAIENNHGAASEQVQLARGGRNRTFDVAVALLFLPLYVVASIAASRRLARRFSPDERFARLVATGMVSVAVSALGLQCLRLWGGVWETIRVGNGHMTSIRAASQTAWLHQVDNQLLGGVLLFGFVALCCNWTRSVEHPVSASHGPHDTLLG